LLSYPFPAEFTIRSHKQRIKSTPQHIHPLLEKIILHTQGYPLQNAVPALYLGFVFSLHREECTIFFNPVIDVTVMGEAFAQINECSRYPCLHYQLPHTKLFLNLISCDMITTKKWYAVYTRPKWERKVSQLLAARKIEAYCPLNKVQRQWSDRKKLLEEPLFTSYVFVHAFLNEHLQIQQTEGVLNFVYWLGAPAVIRDEEIVTIRKFLGEYNNVKLEKAEVNLSDRVIITGGPLGGKEGDVIKINNKTVKVYLPSLGYRLLAEIEKTNITVLKKSSPANTGRRLETLYDKH
jgi:transcription antitermination factor NusG